MVFTGQETQPTVSKYCRKKATKEKPENTNNKITYTYKMIYNKKDRYKAQQVP